MQKFEAVYLILIILNTVVVIEQLRYFQTAIRHHSFEYFEAVVYWLTGP